MVSKATRDELLRLSPTQRLLIAQDLWDSVIDQPDALALSEEQRAVLDERLAAYESDPQAGSSWQEVRKRIQDSGRRVAKRQHLIATLCTSTSSGHLTPSKYESHSSHNQNLK